jgi:Protein kinase domain
MPQLAPQPHLASTRKSSWRLGEGDELVPGRTVLRSLGGGKRYEAYLTWDDSLFAIVVAKVLRPDRAEDRSSLKALRAEAAMLSRLAHPVIVRQFDAVFDGPRPHLVLEHLEGSSLSTLLKKVQTLPLEQLLPLALHIAAAIHYLATESTRASGHQAGQPGDGRAAADDRPQHRAHDRAGGAARSAGRHACVHGARAVRAGRAGRDRAGG